MAAFVNRACGIQAGIWVIRRMPYGEGNVMKVRDTVHPCGAAPSVAASPGEEDGYGNEAIAAAYAEYLWTEGWKPCG